MVEKVGLTHQNKKDKNKKLFLTYIGLLKVLFSSRTKSANKFVKWASKTLFVAQMGTIVQKTQLVSRQLIRRISRCS